MDAARMIVAWRSTRLDCNFYLPSHREYVKIRKEITIAGSLHGGQKYKSFYLLL